MKSISLGIIGGSGFYALDRLENPEERNVETPFGSPSGPIVSGTANGYPVHFIPRHGPGHAIPPSALNHRANVCGLKMCGVTHLLSVTAVGSLLEDRLPGDIVLPDQYFDRTKQNHTFFDTGIAAHVPFGDPTCNAWRGFIHGLAEAQAARIGRQAFNGGTYVNMEGPAFSTRAESQFYRSLKASVIGMTSLPEAKLAREAEMCYAAMAMVTDFDCWHEEEGHVTADAVVIQARKNVELATSIIVDILAGLDHVPSCQSACSEALAGAIMTQHEALSDEVKQRLKPIIGHRL
jgi:5'-methylthioadenosine phosphorylase